MGPIEGKTNWFIANWDDIVTTSKFQQDHLNYHTTSKKHQIAMIHVYNTYISQWYMYITHHIKFILQEWLNYLSLTTGVGFNFIFTYLFINNTYFYWLLMTKPLSSYLFHESLHIQINQSARQRTSLQQHFKLVAFFKLVHWELTPQRIECCSLV